MGFERILVAVDAGPIAAKAADVAIDLARSLGAEIGFVHVIDISLGYAVDSGVPAAELIKMAEDDGKRVVGAYSQRAGLSRPALELVPSGRPAEEIVKAAKRWPADLIVIGSHGRAGVTRALLGSVAEGVMRHAPCPTLVVRAEG